MSTLYLVSPLDIESENMSEKRFAMIKAVYKRAQEFCIDRNYEVHSLLQYSSFGIKEYQVARLMAKRKEWKDSALNASQALFDKHSLMRDLTVVILPSAERQSPLLEQLKRMATRSLVPVRKIEQMFKDTDPERFTLNMADLSRIDEDIERSFFERFSKPERVKTKGENAK